MDTQTQENNEPNEVSPVARGLSVGAALREAREQQGLSIDDVYGRIKFAPRQIVALEADDFSAIPEGAFLRGFVRSYARMLQLDEQRLIAALPSGAPAIEALPAGVAVDVPLPSESDGRKAVLLRNVAIAAAVVLLGSGVWAVFGSHGSGEEGALPAGGEPVAVSAVAAAPEASAPVLAEPVAVAPVVSQVEAVAQSAVAVTEPPLRLVFVEGSWAEVRDKHGAMLMSQRNPAGSEQSFQGEAPFYVAIARVSGVRLYFKGRLVDLTPNTTNGSARLKLE